MLTVLRDTLIFCAAWIIFIPVIISIIFYARLNTGLRVLSIHLFIAAAVEAGSYVLFQYRLNNMPLLHFYTLSEFILLYVFYELYFGNTFPKRLLRGVFIGFVLFSLINSLFIQSIYTFNNYARGLEALLLIGFSLLCFYKILAVQAVHRGKDPVVWINSGILIYFSGAFALFILSNYVLTQGRSLNMQIWTVHAFLSIQLYIFISIGLWNARTR